MVITVIVMVTFLPGDNARNVSKVDLLVLKHTKTSKKR